MIKNKFILLLVITMKIFEINLFSQTTTPPPIVMNKIYKVDTILNKITEQVDFDVPFYILKQYSYDIEPTKIGFYRYKSFQKGKQYTVNDNMSSIKYKSKDTTNLLIPVNGLDPGYYYEFIINRKMNSLEIDSLYSYINRLIASTVDDSIKVKKIINFMNKNNFLIHDNDPAYIETFEPKLQERLKQANIDYKESLQKLLYDFKIVSDSIKDEIKFKNNEIDSIINLKEFPLNTNFISSDTGFIKKIYDCEPCRNDSSAIFKGQRIITNLKTLLNILLNLEFILKNKNAYKGLLNGNFSVDSLNISESILGSSKDVDDLKKCYNNISKTFDQLGQIQFISLYLNHETDGTINTLIKDIYFIKLKYKAIIDKQAQQKKNLIESTYTISFVAKKDNTSVTQPPSLFFEKYDYINSSTYSFSFTTRSTFQITPEFGLVYYGLDQINRGPNGANAEFKGVMPYVGFHINFRYVHSDIPFRLRPNKDIISCYRFSAFVGFSLISIKQTNERADFLGGTNLLLGMGYRLSNYIRVVAGGLLFRKDNPNPLITNYSPAFTPYVGFSLDLRLSDLLKGINKIINY